MSVSTAGQQRPHASTEEALNALRRFIDSDPILRGQATVIPAPGSAWERAAPAAQGGYPLLREAELPALIRRLHGVRIPARRPERRQVSLRPRSQRFVRNSVRYAPLPGSYARSPVRFSRDCGLHSSSSAGSISKSSRRSSSAPRCLPTPGRMHRSAGAVTTEGAVTTVDAVATADRREAILAQTLQGEPASSSRGHNR